MTLMGAKYKDNKYHEHYKQVDDDGFAISLDLQSLTSQDFKLL